MNEILGALARIIHVKTDPGRVPFRFFYIPDVLDDLRSFPERLYVIIEASGRSFSFKKDNAPPLCLLYLRGRGLESIEYMNGILSS
jgi:hypothetical protein